MKLGKKTSNVRRVRETAKERRKEDKKPGRCFHDLMLPHPLRSSPLTYHLSSESLQSWPTLCDPMDCSPLGSSIYGILQARVTGVDCHALLQGIFLTQD